MNITSRHNPRTAMTSPADLHQRLAGTLVTAMRDSAPACPADLRQQPPRVRSGMSSAPCMAEVIVIPDETVLARTPSGATSSASACT